MLSCPCAPGAGAAVASMRWHSRLLSARAVATRPTALCQDVPASTARRDACSNAVASIGRGPICTAERWCQSVGCWMWYACHLAVWWSAAARNVRRRPRKAKKAMEAQCQSIKCVLLLCRFRSCDSSAAIPERSPTPLHYPLARAPRATKETPNTNGTCFLDNMLAGQQVAR